MLIKILQNDKIRESSSNPSVINSLCHQIPLSSNPSVIKSLCRQIPRHQIPKSSVIKSVCLQISSHPNPLSSNPESSNPSVIKSRVIRTVCHQIPSHRNPLSSNPESSNPEVFCHPRVGGPAGVINMVPSPSHLLSPRLPSLARGRPRSWGDL